MRGAGSLTAGTLLLSRYESCCRKATLPCFHVRIGSQPRRDVPLTGTVRAFLEVAGKMDEVPNRAQLSPALAAEFENLQLIDLFT